MASIESLAKPSKGISNESIPSQAANDGHAVFIRDDVEHPWESDMTEERKLARTQWLAGGRGRKGLRIVIVTERFLPTIDGTVRALSRLLEHLEIEGHECILLGPHSDQDTYAGYRIVGTWGIPYFELFGLKFNFIRPKFLQSIKDFQPDIIHFADPVWLGAQTLMAMQLGLAGKRWTTNSFSDDAEPKGAIVASYHTNLATYATLFGMPWLEPYLWRFQCWLYSKCLITMCPSPSTKKILDDNGFAKVSIWPRGVDVSTRSPAKRSSELRAQWGVGGVPTGFSYDKLVELDMMGQGGVKAKVALDTIAEDGAEFRVENIESHPDEETILLEQRKAQDLPDKVVLLYVGRLSWEKNLHLLIQAYEHLSSVLAQEAMPKLVFVGEGPAKAELVEVCHDKGFDTIFMGFQEGEDLAKCFASADIFAFPSFSETFGQVILEAMASGVPVVGLDAEGIQDLVQNHRTGLLLPLPEGQTSWATVLKHPFAPLFDTCAKKYAELLAKVVGNHSMRMEMGKKACTEGIRGFTWWDAMEQCVDGYREGLRMTLNTDSRAQVTDTRLSSGFEHLLKYSLIVGFILITYECYVG